MIYMRTNLIIFHITLYIYFIATLNKELYLYNDFTINTYFILPTIIIEENVKLTVLTRSRIYSMYVNCFQISMCIGN